MLVTKYINVIEMFSLDNTRHIIKVSFLIKEEKKRKRKLNQFLDNVLILLFLL